jgi:hypothetical protein
MLTFANSLLTHCRTFRIFTGFTLLLGLVLLPFNRSTSVFADEKIESRATTPSDNFLDLPSAKDARRKFLAGLGVDRWHNANFEGQGIKIAILDSGFRGYKTQLGKALPDHVAVRSFRNDGNLEARDSQHGVLCGEVLHALAPEADLLLANWDPDQPEQFLDAVRWAKKEGARLISCSLIMPSWSDGEGHGSIHAGLKKLLGDGSKSDDVLFFASSGNTAQRHWSGSICPNEGGFHEWQPHDIDNEILPWGVEPISVEMCWADKADYKLTVIDALREDEVAVSESSIKGPRGSAVVRFNPQTGHSYHLKVQHVAGKNGDFHLVILGGGLKYAKAAGSIPFPGDGQEVIAVGAVDEEGRRQPYSSCGPNSSRPKPDLVAVVPFTSLWRSRPFAGTSAAAPQAAGLAALVWSRHPQWTAAHVRQSLQESAHDLGPKGHDCETGYGCVALPRVK